MADFSISEALGAGFKVIRRKPGAVFMWGLAYFVIGVLPIILVLALGIQGFVAMLQEMAADPSSDPNPYATGMMTGPLALIQPVGLLAGVASMAVVMNAVFRAVLEPEDDRFFYLRFGGVELWQGLVQLCYRILLGVVAFGVLLVALIIGGIVAVAVMAGGVREFQPWMVLPCFLLGLVVLAAILWFALRLSMGGPLTFMDRTFRLFESWSLTRGHTGSLFLLAICVILIIFLIEIVVGAVLFGLFLAIAGGLMASVGEAGFKSYFAQSPAVWLPLVVAFGLAAAVIGCAVSGFVFAIVIAPWAEACRQLRGEPAAPPAVSEGPVVTA